MIFLGRYLNNTGKASKFCFEVLRTAWVGKKKVGMERARNSECRESDTSKKFSVPAQLLRAWESLHLVPDPSK